MKKMLPFILVSMLIISSNSFAQIPDDTNGHLYLLCKTWGYFKYFNQHKCELQWDTLLNTTVEEVLAADNNEEFNTALMTMFNKVGNNAVIYPQPPNPDTNINFDDSWIDDPVLSQEVRVFLDTFSVHLYPDYSDCLVSLNDYSDPNYYSYINFLDDPLSNNLNLTIEADRLTYMFYYWNIINYFFPYRNIMDQPWDSTLYQFIPQFREALTVADFHITFLRMVTKINDTHGYTSSSILNSNLWKGNYLPKIYFKRIDTNCVVAKVDGINGVTPGDILTHLKNIPISYIEDSLEQFIPASTEASYFRDAYYYMLRGTQYTNITMTFTDSNNVTYTVTAPRSVSVSGWYTWRDNDWPATSYYLTECDYGYVHMGLLEPEEVTGMYNTLKNAPAIIFDIRNYPNGTLWDLGPLFFLEPIISAIYYSPALMPYSTYLPGWYDQENDLYNLGSWFNPDAYYGKVYILVNEETQSQAEYTCQYLSHHWNARVIGSQTAGADGNVSYLMLPGGIYTYFTSLGWYYDDGYQQQRNGVKIDTVVTPSIQGIRQGKDEVLLAALDCLLGTDEPQTDVLALSVYPNPVSRVLTVSGQRSAVSGQQSAVSGQRSAVSGLSNGLFITITDLYGREVLEPGKITSFPYQVDVSGLPDAVYILRFTDEKMNSGAVKFLKSCNY